LEATEKTARLMRFVFSSPKPLKTGVLIIVFSIVFGLITVPEKSLLSILLWSIVIFALPAFLSGIISKPLAESFDGVFHLRRSMLLSFICLLIVGCLSIIGFLFNKLSISLIFGYSSIIWLRHAVLLGTSNSKHIRSFLASATQTLFGFTAFYFMLPEPKTILWLLFTAIFFFSGVAFIEIAKKPMKKSFMFNSLELLKHALAHLTDGSLELEQFFEANAEEIDADIGVLSFRNKKGVKAAVVVPNVHPGPFGKLGGSNLPSKIAENFDHPVFVLHSASTHDLNPVNADECIKIADAVKVGINEVKYTSEGSRLTVKKSEAVVSAQFFGDTVLIVHSPLKPTDDLEPEIGARSVLKAKKMSGFAFFVDSHNYLEKGADSVNFGSELSSDIIDLAERTVSSAKESVVKKIRVGISSKKIYSDDVGELGVMALVTEADKQRTAYLLWDGNNMLKGIREDIVEKLRDIVDESVILTTDNHSVNITMDGFNPVGSAIKNIDSVSRDVVKEAVNDLEEVDIGGHSRTIRIKVTGRGNTEKLASTVNSTLSILKYAVPASLGAGVLACGLVVMLL